MYDLSLKLDLKISHRLDDHDPLEWDQLGGGRPFTSYRWYAYGEAVMSDCKPVYITLRHRRLPIARATFWLVANEPLPVDPPLVRGLLQKFTQRWPLMVCRSPLSNGSGLILPEPPLRETALAVLIEAAEEQASREGASFVVYDFVEHEHLQELAWPLKYRPMTVADPGTQMALAWPSFHAYISHLGKNGRKHFKRTREKSREQQLTVQRHSHVTQIDEAEALIRNVEQRYHSAPNPWIRRMHECLPMVDGTWLAAVKDGQLIGCELALRDNGTQVSTALGLADNSPYTYFALGYENIRLAFENDIRLLRWGSGAYDIKRRLGFELEDNNHAVIASSSRLASLAARFAP